MVTAEIHDAPATLSEYIAKFWEILSLLQKGDAFRLRGDYLPAWTARGYLMELIFGKGYMEVEVDRNATLEQFLLVNPDRHNNLSTLQQYFAKKYGKEAPCTIKEFLRRALGASCAKCNVLTASMWLCLGDDIGFRSTDFESDVGSWQVAAKNYRREHGVMPHAVLVAQSLR